MTEASLPERRAFLVKLAAGPVALGLTGSLPTAFAAEPRRPADLKPRPKLPGSVPRQPPTLSDMPTHAT